MFTCMYCYLWHTSYQLPLTHLSFTAQATEIIQASYSGPTHQEPEYTDASTMDDTVVILWYTPNAWLKADLCIL